jgi:catechol 2,3-dioxygenase-like lactoylglutathione lyase family enzyme
VVELKHVALTIDSKKHAVQFYEQVLDGKLVREFEISSDLVTQIFSITVSDKIPVMVFDVNLVQFEIFIVDDQKFADRFDHVCISVNDVNEFKKQCLTYGLPVSVIPKGEKELVFIKDFVGNLFEIKQRV